MKKVSLLFFSLFFWNIYYAQEPTSILKTNNINLSIKNIQNVKDVNLLTQLILKNKQFISSYLPQKYSKNTYNFQITTSAPTSQFFDFLTAPKAGFSLKPHLVANNSIEVYFQPNKIQSLNYPNFFEGSKLEKGLIFFFDNSADYQRWKPSLLELEKNDSFVTSNHILIKEKLFATLNSRQDKDFYILNTSLLEDFFIQINVLSQKEAITLNVYNEKFFLLKQFVLAENSTPHRIKFSNPLENKILYLKFFSNSKKGLFAGSKNFNVNYIFFSFYDNE